MARKTAKQLEQEIEESLQRELQEQQAKRAQRAPLPSPSESYEGQMHYWDEYAKRWGKAAAIERARSAVAGGFLGRDFGETAASFDARSPKQRANADWLRIATGK